MWSVVGGGGQAASRVRHTGRHPLSYVRRKPRRGMSAAPGKSGLSGRGKRVGASVSLEFVPRHNNAQRS